MAAGQSHLTYLFEDAELATRLRALFPEHRDAIHSIWELLDATPSPDREAVLAFLPEPLHDQIEPILNAIRLFRGAMVLTAEDVDYSLANLGQTPRVRGLRGILHAYLEGPGATDGFSRLGEWLEALKSGEPLPFLEADGKLCFVPGAEPTLFFRELAKAAEVSREVRVKEVWELPWTEVPSRRGLVVKGNWRESLKALARQAVRARKAHTVHFSIGAEPGRIGFLQRYLDHLNYPAREIQPFSLLSPPPGHVWLAYCDASALQPTPGDNWLRSGELEQLHQAGFPLARPAERKHRMNIAMQSLQDRHPTRRWLFTSLDKAQLPANVRTVGLPDRKAGPARAESPTQLTLPPRPFSATQLETYVRCPSQYFFSNRLRLQRKDQPDRTFPLLFGQAVHRALEESLKENQPDLKLCFEKALREVAPILTPEDPLWWIFSENFAQLSQRFYTLEKQLREMLGPLTPKAFEQPFEIEIEGVTIKGVIDRIDNHEQGLLLLDYKTGTVSFTPNHMGAGENFQALLYLVAAEKVFDRPCLGLIFYDLKKGEVRRGVLLADRVPSEAKAFMTRGHILPPEKYDELRGQGLEHLRRIASEIRAGNFAPTPSAEVCGYCDYASLCQKGMGYA